MKRLIVVLPLLVLAVSCSRVKQVVVKDIPLEEQQRILEQYRGRSAWTRTVIEDVGEGGSVPRDAKVKIVDVDMHFNGAVTVETAKDHRFIVHALGIERPLTPEKIHARLAELFWFQDPLLRQVSYIRKWGKRAARAIMKHEVYIGMPAGAAEASWGVPAKRNVSEVGGKRNEQWVYPVGKRSRYIYIIDGKVSKYEK